MGGIILIIISIVMFSIANSNKSFFTSALAGMILSVGVMKCHEEVNKNVTPTALDVYRGKTTLEIVYRDSVAVDSVVVFKK